MNTRTITARVSVSKQTLIGFISAAGAVILPQLFHIMGIAFGAGSSLGAAFLPMHIPVIIAGLIAGPFAGGIAGFVSPIVSFYLTGMPSSLLLPFMVVELCVYGITSGFIAKAKINMVFKVLIVQAAGRLAKFLAIILAVNFLSVQNISGFSVIESIVTGLPGTILQIVLAVIFVRKNDR